MNDLKELSKLHKVNKYDLGYIDVYEIYFDKIKNKNLQILEIGVDKGPSLKLWSKYFQNSKIVGIDNKYIKLDIENVETFFGDQTDIEFLKKIINKFKYFDIIIDDGSHISKHVIKSFKFLFYRHKCSMRSSVSHGNSKSLRCTNCYISFQFSW